MKLEPFVTTKYVGNVHLQELDYAGAMKAGFSPTTLDIASEMISFQNEYALSAD
jgi:hypothetical protein